MNIDEEKFHGRLRLYDRHKIFLVSSLVIGGLGILTSPWGLPLVVLSGLFQVLAGLKAREGGRSAITGLSIGMGDESFGVGIEEHWTTREIDSLTNQERLVHARSTGYFLIATGIGMIIVGVVVTIAVLRAHWAL